MAVLVEGNNEINISLVPIPPLVANLYGVVTDAETGYPISDVKITINSLVTYTSSSGIYTLEGLLPGNYTIKFEKEGYETAYF